MRRTATSRLSDVVVQLAAASALCVIATAQPLQLELAKRGNQGTTPFHTPTAVLVTEVIKLFIALGTWLCQYRTLEYTGLEEFRWFNSIVFAVPALLFAVQNNLVYFAMQDLDPPTFQLWACFKLIPVGVFSRALLGKRLSPVQWCALLLLALGMANTTQGGGGAKHTEAGGGRHQSANVVRGIATLVFNGCLSGLSTVLNEWLIKFQDPRAPLMFKNLQIYLWGSFICAAGASPSTVGQLLAPLPALIVLTNACAGLCVSAVLKYCDSLVKGFSTSVSVLLAMGCSSLLFEFRLTRPFSIGVAVVCCSFYLYFGAFNARLLRDEEEVVGEIGSESDDNERLLATPASALQEVRSSSNEDPAATSPRVKSKMLPLPA